MCLNERGARHCSCRRPIAANNWRDATEESNTMDGDSVAEHYMLGM